ncbi:NAD(P)H-hydrate dehydratase [Brevundimonas sp. GCM10030266]|uniref:NAD(P)H-hydrate dehydratase n=1 Tax=Brevundimonas sp. GCM10030266 TaxID=3273386 RepID=UPI0036131358
MTVLTLDDAAVAALPLPSASEQQDKHDRGTAFVVAGGAAVPGAARLTGEAALRVGAGRVTLAAPRSLGTALGQALPEARIVLAASTPDGELAGRAGRALAAFARDADALVIGPGLLAADDAVRLSLALMETQSEVGVVIDAAALPDEGTAERFSALARDRAILTPHAGEMARMRGVKKTAVVADPVEHARWAAARFRSVVVMKGATTHVASPSGGLWRHAGGVAGLATSGSGDVLAGIIGGLLARGAPPTTAALWGVRLHAAAGEWLSQTIGPTGFLASDLLAVLPGVLCRLEAGSTGTAEA